MAGRARPPARAAVLPVRARRPRPRLPSPSAAWPSSGHGRPPSTACGWPPTSPTGWRRAGSPWSAAPRTASTPPPTGPPSLRTGATVAVLACGADRAYPTAHRGMLDQIAAVGAVVSEVPVGCAPYRSRFLARNRIIALLARATVVVEANLRSGSLTTAKAAREHHLPVGAVPGPVTSMTSAGCHALLRETDAVLVTDAAEVAELAARIGEDLLPDDRGRARQPAPGDDLDPESYRVWSAVPLRGGATLDRLASASGVEPRRLVGILAVLDAEGLVTKQAGRWRKTRLTTSEVRRVTSRACRCAAADELTRCARDRRPFRRVARVRAPPGLRTGQIAPYRACLRAGRRRVPRRGRCRRRRGPAVGHPRRPAGLARRALPPRSRAGDDRANVRLAAHLLRLAGAHRPDRAPTRRCG